MIGLPSLSKAIQKMNWLHSTYKAMTDSTILTWVDFAYNKIHSFENTKPDCASRKENAKIKTTS